MFALSKSTFDANDSSSMRIYFILRVFILIGLSIFFIFFVLDYFTLNNKYFAYVNLCSGSVFFLLFLDLHFNKNLSRAKYVTLFLLFIHLIIFININQAKEFGLIWTLLFPVASIVLLGVKKGPIIAAIYFIILFTMAYNGIGVWDNGEWSQKAFLRLVSGSLVFTFGIYITEVALENSYINLEKLSTIDPLTSLYNRRKINNILQQEVDKANRYKTVLSLILFDIDDFKKINDNFGHNAGDKVLVKLSKTLLGELRNGDSLARWGGEEFLVVLPMQNLDEAKTVAEKLRLSVEAMGCDINSLTCSFGVAQYDETKDSLESFINKADNAMYKAKENGKNQVSD